MAGGAIVTRERTGRDGKARKFYEIVVELGKDPVTGKRRQRSQSFPSYREAKKALAALQAEVDTGTVVDRSRQTVADTLRYWLETYARHNVRQRTCLDYEQTIKNHIIPALGAVQVQKLTPAQVQQFYADKLAQGCGPRTVQLCHLRLSQALKQAVELGIVPRNVAAVVRPPRVEHHEMTTWTAEQARRFMEVAVGSHFGPVWTVMLATGMRRGEVLGLRWQDVDMERGTLSVRQTVGVLNGAPEMKPPKSKSSRRTVPVQSAVIDALREHKARQNERRLQAGSHWHDHDLIFCCGNGNPINPNNLTRDYNRWVALAGVPRIRVHDQRHTHVTLAIAAGAPIKAVSQRVGHAKTSITMDLYAHAMPEQHIEVADKVGAVLFGPQSHAI